MRRVRHRRSARDPHDRRNTLRAALTVLGILIGVAAVVVVTALGDGARESVGSQIESLGSNFIIVFPQQSNASGARGAQGGGVRLTEDDGKAIEREAVSIAAVAPVLRAQAQFVYDGQERVDERDRHEPRFLHRAQLEGEDRRRSGTSHDEALKSKVCLLGTTVVKNLFGDTDPDRSLHPRRPLLVPRHRRARVEGAGAHRRRSRRRRGHADRQHARAHLPHAAGLRGRAHDVRDLAPTRTTAPSRRSTSILRQRHHIAEGREPDFAIRTQKEFLALQQTVYGALTALLTLVAAVALVVGGIGVMNIMLVSVTERTREIGIRMAIGAREGDIRSQFLVEAIVLAFLGGVAGVGVGLILVPIIGALRDVQMSISPSGGDAERARERAHRRRLRVLPRATSRAPRSDRSATARVTAH